MNGLAARSSTTGRRSAVIWGSGSAAPKTPASSPSGWQGTSARPSGVRVSELVRIRIADVDLDACRIRITQGKGDKDRVVPFPAAFKETLALHIDAQGRAGAAFLFESSWKKPYSDRGVRKILARYTQAAGITAPISPHTLRHFLFTWLKTQGIDDALIQPYSGHATRQSLEIYSRLALADAQQRYDDAIGDFPV